MEQYTKYTYRDATVILEKRKYANNGRLRIDMIDIEDGTPYATVTVNLTYAKLTENEIAVKDHSENEGMLKFLQDNGIVGPVKRYAKSGYVEIPIVEFNG
jgi:hypothetical protein